MGGRWTEQGSRREQISTIAWNDEVARSPPAYLRSCEYTRRKSHSRADRAIMGKCGGSSLGEMVGDPRRRGTLFADFAPPIRTRSAEFKENNATKSKPAEMHKKRKTRPNQDQQKVQKFGFFQKVQNLTHPTPSCSYTTAGM